MNGIKHSVVIICYNQGKYIGETIESAVSQSVVPYEVIISDDCSSDNTWEIIQEYKNRYPDIIKPYQNEKNIGLYPNFNSALKRITGNVLSLLGGDDFFNEGLFENLNKVIEQNKIDVDNESFIIVTNTGHYYPNGKITTWANYKYKNRSVFKEQLRGGVSLRWIGYSAKLLPYFLAEENIGYGADWLRNTKLYYHCPKYYFANFVSTYYRVGVGVTSKLKVKNFAEHNKLVIPMFLKDYAAKISPDDLRYLKYAEALNNYQLTNSFANYCKALGLLFLNINNFAVNNGILKQFKNFIPFKGILYSIRKMIYKY